MKFLDFKSITIFFEFIKNYHYTFYIIFFIGYVISCYIYFYHYFNKFDFAYVQYFSLLELLKLSGLDTVTVFGISIILVLFTSFISLYITYLIFAKKKFLDYEKQIDSFESDLNTIDKKSEDCIKKIEKTEEKIHTYNFQEKCDENDLLEETLKMRGEINIHKDIVNDSKKKIIELRNNLKIKFSVYNLILLIGILVLYNYTFSETLIKKHEYPTATITFTEENKTQDYKLLGNLETSILLSDDKLTKLEIIEKSNVLSINIKSNEKIEENYFTKVITYFKEIIIKISSFFNKNKEDN